MTGALHKRSEKTCRRLEQELGLPVHRLEETPKARVFAYKEELDVWIKKTQHSEEMTLPSGEITLSITSKKLLIPALAVFAAIITAFIIWPPWSLEKHSSIPSGKPSLAVMYFENNSGDKGLDYLRDVQLNLLITDLNQSKYISVISQDRIYSILQNLKLDMADKYSSEHLAAISERCGVSNIVTGSYYTPGDRFIFNVSFKKLLVGENVTFTEEGDNVPDIIDSISLRIKSELGLNREQIASDTDEKAGIIRSYSPDALNYSLRE